MRKPKETSNKSDVPSKEKVIHIEKHFGKETEIENKFDLKFSKSDNNFDESVNETKVKEIINHARIPLNINANFYNNNSKNAAAYNQQAERNVDYKAIPKNNINLEELRNQYNENTTKNESKIKKIYRRNNNNFDNRNNNFNNNNNKNDNSNEPNVLNNKENRRFKNNFVRKYDQFYMKDDEVNLGNAINCTEYNQSNRIFKTEIIACNSVYYFKFSPNVETNGMRSNKNVIKTIHNTHEKIDQQQSINVNQN